MEDRWKKINIYSPPVPHLLQAQQAFALLYSKEAGRPGTGSLNESKQTLFLRTIFIAKVLPNTIICDSKETKVFMKSGLSKRNEMHCHQLNPSTHNPGSIFKPLSRLNYRPHSIGLSSDNASLLEVFTVTLRKIKLLSLIPLN